MKKRILLPMAVLLLTFCAAAVYVATSSSGLQWLARGLQQMVPGLSIEAVSGRLLSGFTVQGLRYQSDQQPLQLQHLEVDWQAGELMQGRLHVTRLLLRGLTVPLAATKNSTEPATAWRFPEITVPLAIRIDDFSGQDLLLLDSQGQELQKISQLKGAFELDERHFHLHDFRVDAVNGIFQLTGSAGLTSVAPVQLQGDWQFTPPGGGTAWTGNLQVLGTALRPQVRVEIVAPCTATALVYPRLQADFPWQAEITATAGLLSELQPGWPKLPLQLAAKLQGEKLHYRGVIEAASEIPQAGTIKASVNLDGDTGQLLVSALQLHGAMGELQLQDGLLDWQDGLRWQAALNMREANPALFFPHYNGKIAAQVTTSGHISDASRQAELRIQELSGQLREYPVQASGSLRLDQNRLQADGLRLASGQAVLSINGHIEEELALDVQLKAENLGEVLADAAGSLLVQGQLTGDRQAPQLTTKVQARNITYKDLRLAALSLHSDGIVAAGQTMTATVQAEAGQIHGVALDKLTARLQGSLDAHHLELQATAPSGQASLQLTGSWQDRHWQGTFDQLFISAEKIGRWSQKDQAQLQITSTASILDHLCLTSAQGQLCASGKWQTEDSQWQISLDGQELALSMVDQFLGHAGVVAGRAILQLTAAGNRQRLEKASLDCRIDNGKSIGFDVLPGWERVEYTDTRLQGQLVDGDLHLQLHGELNHGNTVAAEVTVLQAADLQRPWGELALEGRVRAHMENLDFVGPITHYTVIPVGRADGDMRLSGQLLRPELAGVVQLEKGRVDLSTFGVSLHDVHIDAVLNLDIFHLQVQATSGPGSMTGTGTLEFPRLGSVLGDFRLQGENFNLLHRPEYQIRTSPDVRLTFDEHHGKLSGLIRVPQAQITPEQMKSTLSTSRDVIIIDTDQQDEHVHWDFLTDLRIVLGEEVMLDGYGLHGKLRGELAVNNTRGSYLSGKGELSLHEGSFSIYGRHLQMVRGRILFAGGPIDDPGIDARAQKMVSSETSGSSDWVVGVDVSGTAKDLDFKLISEPFLEDRDILAYLVSGKSMSNTSAQEENLLASAAKLLGLEEGAGLVQNLTSLLQVEDVFLEGTSQDGDMSLVVGKRLTEDLFIGYDHNFFEQKGEFKIRYNLGRGFAIETRSSGSGTGGDLFYSFEN